MSSPRDTRSGSVSGRRSVSARRIVFGCGLIKYFVGSVSHRVGVIGSPVHHITVRLWIFSTDCIYTNQMGIFGSSMYFLAGIILYVVRLSGKIF